MNPSNAFDIHFSVRYFRNREGHHGSDSTTSYMEEKDLDLGPVVEDQRGGRRDRGDVPTSHAWSESHLFLS